MTITSSARLLLLIASYFDYRERVASVRNVLEFLAGDPRFHRHRQWAEEFLRKKDRRYRAVNNLKRRGYLEEKIFRRGTGYVLTPKGERKVQQVRLVDSAKRKKFGGGQWLMVFFDIPEELRRQRDNFRFDLRELGFELLQKSVWATPYDVRRELKELLQRRGLTPYVKPLLVKNL